jgi:predicted nucleic acid-binding protein
VKTLFLDTNIVIDFLADRKPFSVPATKLFKLAFQREVMLYISAISYNNIYYLFQKSYTHLETIVLLKSLLATTQTVELGQSVINQALNAKFADFEDAIQYHCALGIPGLQGIVTRNAKDFRKSELPVLSPHEALALF